MVRHLQLLGLGTLAILASASLHAQQPTPPQSQVQPKRQVSVELSGDDSVGSQLAYAVREEIRRSSTYELAPRKEALFRIDIVSLDPDQGKATSGVWTIAAVVFTMRNWVKFDETDPQTWYPIHLDAMVVKAGNKVVDSSARSIVAKLDESVEEFRRQMRPHQP